MDGGRAIDIISLDFFKAFDVVNHTVLIDKLAALGFSAPLLQWIQSFLMGRIMLVSVGGFESDSYSVVSGVPQGSVICIYKWYAFADDFEL